MSLQLNPRYLNFIKKCTPEKLDKFQAFWKENERALLLNLDPTSFEEKFPSEFKFLSETLNAILNDVLIPESSAIPAFIADSSLRRLSHAD